MVILLSNILEYKDDSFSLVLKSIGEEHHIHCKCWNWKLSTLKMMYKVAADFEKRALDLGIKEVYSISPNPKFCEMLGAEMLVKPEGCLDEEYEVMKWVLTQ